MTVSVGKQKSRPGPDLSSGRVSGLFSKRDLHNMLLLTDRLRYLLRDLLLNVARRVRVKTTKRRKTSADKGDSSR